MMRKQVLTIVALCAGAVSMAAIIPAVVPQAVPTANKRGNATVFQLATSTATATAGTPFCDDGSGNTTTAGCTSAITIASGSSALGTGAIASATCAAAVTTAATGTVTTDTVSASFNSDPTAVTGYIPSTAGMLTIVVYPTVNNVNFKVCNNTTGSITPGAITLNWRVSR